MTDADGYSIRHTGKVTMTLDFRLQASCVCNPTFPIKGSIWEKAKARYRVVTKSKLIFHVVCSCAQWRPSYIGWIWFDYFWLILDKVVAAGELSPWSLTITRWLMETQPCCCHPVYTVSAHTFNIGLAYSDLTPNHVLVESLSERVCITKQYSPGTWSRFNP